MNRSLRNIKEPSHTEVALPVHSALLRAKNGVFLHVPVSMNHLLSSIVCEVLYFWFCFAFVLLSFFVPFVLRNNLCAQVHAEGTISLLVQILIIDSTWSKRSSFCLFTFSSCSNKTKLKRVNKYYNYRTKPSSF